jgi:2-dehydropantoate 2-reductase
VGARLSHAGHAVTLAGTWPAALEAIDRHGLRVDHDGGSVKAPALALPLDGRTELPRADVVLVLVKAHRTASVSKPAADAARDGILATLQNGLGNREALEAAAGAGRVVVGVTTAGATLLGPAHVRGHMAETLIGATADARAEQLASLLRGAGLPARVTGDIEVLLWSKLAVNCAINPLTALNGVANGALLARPEWRAAMAAAAGEVQAVAAAHGIVLEDPADRAYAVAQVTAANRSSMLQDLERGAATEIDAICGAVVREGQRVGVPTPVNAAMLQAVHAREAALAAVR